MATTNQTLKDIGNTAYNSLLIASGAVASRYISAKVLGMKDRPLEFKLKSLGMLALDIGASNGIITSLQKSGTIPKTIFN